jgi:type I restriction enzyme S subunit
MKKVAHAEAPPKNPLHGKFDEMVDAVLGGAPQEEVTPVIPRAKVETWEIPLQDIYSNQDVRLDASHYDQTTAVALSDLKKSRFKLRLLSDMADVRLPGQFVRIWAKDREYGIPYVNASDLMSLMGIGQLGDSTRYLSKETETDLEELTIKEGWLLMSCSGTIGRVFYVPKRLHNWVATHDLIRIIPKDTSTTGFLHAYLSSEVAQKQIAGHTHGGQIDHVTHHQIGTVLVPMFGGNAIAEIHSRTMEALRLRESAIETLANVARETERLISG